MRKPILLAATLALTGVAGLAMAQAPTPPAPDAAPSAPQQAQPPGPPPGGPRGPGMEGRGPMRGPDGSWRDGRGPRFGHGPGGYGHWDRGHRGPPSGGASFRFERGPAEIDIRCAEDEPTRACVDAAIILLDKLNSMPPR